MRFRFENMPEQIELRAHKGECKYCDGIVKMRRNDITLALEPDDCMCLKCGQRYYVVIMDDIVKWEIEQWKQKYEDDSKGELDASENN